MKKNVTDNRSSILQGTLDLMVLKTLDAMGPLHGYGIALRIEQLSDEVLRVNQGTVYASLVRLVQKGWIRADWGSSRRGEPVLELARIALSRAWSALRLDRVDEDFRQELASHVELLTED